MKEKRKIEPPDIPSPKRKTMNLYLKDEWTDGWIDTICFQQTDRMFDKLLSSVLEK